MHDFSVFVNFSVGDFAVCISLHCGSDRVNSPPRGLLFHPRATEKLIVVGFPMILVFYGFIYVFGLTWVHLHFWVDVGSY